jgi:phosphatidylglycerol:prolipoprotein diacylglycerol transferase
MHPILFKIPVPEFLQFLLPSELVIASYGTLIALGILISTSYAQRQTKRELNLNPDTFWDMILMLIILSVIGGKVFFYLEDPMTYLADPSMMFKNIGNGFVFYGALIFSILGLTAFFWKKNLPSWHLFDIIAVMLTILHPIGRLGCFMAGCCHGVPTDHWIGIAFTDPNCVAKPLNTPLHPTQLYDAAQILLIFIVLRIVEKRKTFHGQVALLYVMLYAIGRSIVEIFRGDEERGYVIENVLSHGQFTSIILFLVALGFYFYIRKRPDLQLKTQTHP